LGLKPPKLKYLATSLYFLYYMTDLANEVFFCNSGIVKDKSKMFTPKIGFCGSGNVTAGTVQSQ